MAKRKGSSDTEVLSGASGAIVVNDAVAKAYNCDMIVILDDATIVTNLEVNGVVANVNGTYITAPLVALPKGAILTPEDGSYFSSITISAGSVNLVKQNYEEAGVKIHTSAKVTEVKKQGKNTILRYLRY